jgi:glycosyltransferase involved in cell wall biosynthesis
MDSPLFSVIIPTYARPDLLAEAVASVLTQTVTDLECIIVDDASRPPPSAPPDPRVRMLRRRVNGGPSAARNTGLSAARGQYVAFLDDDEVYTPRRLELAGDVLSRADIAVCWRRSFDETPVGREVWEERPASCVLEGATQHLGVTALAREATPLFDERLRICEDVEWWIRASSGRTVTTAPAFGCLFRARPIDRETVAAARVNARLQILEWHAPFFHAHGRVAAFQWRRLGLDARIAGDYRLARWAFLRSLRCRLTPRSAWHLVRSAPRPGGKAMLGGSDAGLRKEGTGVSAPR